MAHETAHSIGGLGDEYERYTNKPNTSDTSNPDTIKWRRKANMYFVSSIKTDCIAISFIQVT